MRSGVWCTREGELIFIEEGDVYFLALCKCCIGVGWASQVRRMFPGAIWLSEL